MFYNRKKGFKYNVSALEGLPDLLDADKRTYFDEDSKHVWLSKAGKDLFNEVDLFLVGGGDPEPITLALHLYEDSFFQQMLNLVQDGRAIYAGRSIGAMTAGIDVGLTREFMPNWHHLVTRHQKKGLSGLNLVHGFIRPHYGCKAWDETALAYKVLRGYGGNVVIRIPNGEGLVCFGQGFRASESGHVQGNGHECKMVGDAFKSRERPSPAVLEKYYGLGKAQSWSEIAAVVDQKWGGKPLSEVLNIRPHRRGFTSPTDYPRLYRQKVQNNQGFYGPGCVSVVISELPWAVQWTQMFF